LLDAMLRHGLVDFVPDRSAALLDAVDSVEPQVLYPALLSAIRQRDRQRLLAAIALVAAARQDTRPFSNPIYRGLAAAANDDPQIPVLAVAIWVKFVAMNGWPDDFRVTHAGLPAVWARALNRRQQDAALLAQIACDLGSLEELKPQAREFLTWYTRRPAELTSDERFKIAGSLARYFGMPDRADALLWGLGNPAGWSMSGLRIDIAVARLAKGYDAASARLIVNSILESFGIAVPRISDYDSGRRDALERAGARDELRELGARYVREAETRPQPPFDSELYAAASDYYRRAGDRERALELARRAAPLMPALVQRSLGLRPVVNRTDPTAAAKAAQGMGTDAAVALYRAGAIDEALETGYLTGNSRNLNAALAGETQDPQWVLDYGWQSDIDFMALELARSGERKLQRRAADGLVRSCGRSLEDCSAQTLRNIAQVAAGGGDDATMKKALGAALRQLDDKGKDADGWALTVAGPWAHCEELLRYTRAHAHL